MDKENNFQENNVSRSSIYRSVKAHEEGRVAHRNGHPPYLEEVELNVFRSRILIETLHSNSLTLKELANMVIFHFEPFLYSFL
jgi:transposase